MPDESREWTCNPTPALCPCGVLWSLVDGEKLRGRPGRTAGSKSDNRPCRNVDVQSADQPFVESPHAPRDALCLPDQRLFPRVGRASQEDCARHWRGYARKPCRNQRTLTVAEYEYPIRVDVPLGPEPRQSRRGICHAVIETGRPVVTLTGSHTALVESKAGEAVQRQLGRDLRERVDAELRGVVVSVNLA